MRPGHSPHVGLVRRRRSAGKKLLLPSEVDPVFRFDEGAISPLTGHRAAGDGNLPLATSAQIAVALLAPPTGAHETRKLRDYLGENAETKAGRRAYDVLLRFVGQVQAGKRQKDESWDQAVAYAGKMRPGAVDALKNLAPAYRRADALALSYGERWRSTLAARSFLLVLASICSGLFGGLFPSLSIVTLPLQFLVAMAVFTDGRHAARQRWREKWIEYRRLAENFRVTRFLLLCGAPAYGGDSDWVDWATRNALRTAAPYDAPDQIGAEILDHLVEVEIGGQIAYHHAAYRRFRSLDAHIRRAATFALIAFGALGAGLVALALFGGSQLHVSIGSVGLALSAAPTLYAALNGVRRDLDVARQASRSAAIALALRRLVSAIAEAPANAATAKAAALRAAAIMREDLDDWRGVVSVL